MGWEDQECLAILPVLSLQVPYIVKLTRYLVSTKMDAQVPQMIRQEVDNYRLEWEKLRDYLYTLFPEYTEYIELEVGQGFFHAVGLPSLLSATFSNPACAQTHRNDVYIAWIPNELTPTEMNHIYTNLRTRRNRIR